MPAKAPLLFALNATHDFGARVAEALGVPLSPHEEREFEDGEHKVRALANVRERDVYAVQSLYGDARASGNDKLVRLLFFLGALRDASAARVTAIVPYLAYARKDAKTQPRDPVLTRYVAALFEAVGVDRVVVLDVHNLAAFQNAFRCRTDHLDTTALFARHLHATLPAQEKLAVVSPDAGGVKRAERLREALSRLREIEVPLAFLEKARARGTLRTGRLVGEVADATAVILDDLISTGSTLALAARACNAAGARRVYAAAAHGLFIGDAAATLEAAGLERVIVTDSVPPFRLTPLFIEHRLTRLSVAPLFAEAIRRIHAGGSLVELLSV